jgi:hypothetical protein
MPPLPTLQRALPPRLPCGNHRALKALNECTTAGHYLIATAHLPASEPIKGTLREAPGSAAPIPTSSSFPPSLNHHLDELKFLPMMSAAARPHASLHHRSLSPRASPWSPLPHSEVAPSSLAMYRSCTMRWRAQRHHRHHATSSLLRESSDGSPDIATSPSPSPSTSGESQRAAAPARLSSGVPGVLCRRAGTLVHGGPSPWLSLHKNNSEKPGKSQILADSPLSF